MEKKSLLRSILGFFVKDQGAISAGIIRFIKVGVLGLIASLSSALFWEEGLTATGLMLVMAGLGTIDKLAKEYLGGALALVLALALAQPAQAQISFEPKDFSVGGGSMFGDEAVTFSWKAAFAAVHWHGLSVLNSGTTGVGVEIHPATMLDGPESIDTVDWRFWSLNRAKMSVLQIPGEIWESMYLGGDVLVAEGGAVDFTEGFSARLVYGIREGPIQVEIYMFERYRPISFSFMYRFQ